MNKKVAREFDQLQNLCIVFSCNHITEKLHGTAPLYMLLFNIPVAVSTMHMCTTYVRSYLNLDAYCEGISTEILFYG